ncbi:MAG: ribosomal protein L3 [Cenarchaeum symbiont of Oopsacas minuta]|nr:ribosomal protein L3 [Cenarchaeum symbiont of Oopsacas minuta]
MYAKDIPKNIAKHISLKNNDDATESAKKILGAIHSIFAIIAISPRDAGLEQKTPYIFETPIIGGDIKNQFDYVYKMLGNQIRIGDVFEIGQTVDAAAITKGKGWQSVITRYGTKRKQHKSRKTVREIGSLGPISPQYVMYTVPRAGQMGFHQRIEYNKRILAIDNSNGESSKINPMGGYKHFGLVKGDYIILKGSVPGTYRRMIKLRSQIRSAPSVVQKPNILEIVV